MGATESKEIGSEEEWNEFLAKQSIEWYKINTNRKKELICSFLSIQLEKLNLKFLALKEEELHVNWFGRIKGHKGEVEYIIMGTKYHQICVSFSRSGQLLQCTYSFSLGA